MKLIHKATLVMLLLTAVLLPSTVFPEPEAANFSTSSSTLSVPLVKIDGILLYKNLDLFMDFARGGFQIRALEEVLPNDIIGIDSMISMASVISADNPF